VRRAGSPAGPRPGKSNAGKIGGIALALVVVGSWGPSRRARSTAESRRGHARTPQAGDALSNSSTSTWLRWTCTKRPAEIRPNKKKAEEEAARRRLQLAARSGSRGRWRQARNLFERCGGDNLVVPAQAQASSDDQRQRAAYAKKHHRGSHRGQVSRQARPLPREVTRSRIRFFERRGQALQPSASRGRSARAEPAGKRVPAPRSGRERPRACQGFIRQADGPRLSGRGEGRARGVAQSPADKNTLMQAYRSLDTGTRT